MSWDILPKANLQYFLSKLKDKLDLKVDAVSGKGLSTNDYTTAEKTKLAGIEAGAQVNDTIDSALSTSSEHAVQNKIITKEVQGTQTASGNPLTLTDAAGINAEDVLVTLQPHQSGSGTPSPSNIRAIQGYDFVDVDRCGKNLFNKNVIEDGAIDRETGALIPYSGYKRTANVIRVKSNTLYTASGFASNADLRVFFYDANDNYLTYGSYNNAAFTTPNNCAYIRLRWANTSLDSAQIEEGTATTYEPYTGNTLSVQVGNKNLLPMTVEGIKELNNTLTWNGNSATRNGITYTIFTNKDGCVAYIDANGTANAESTLTLGTCPSDGKPYKLNGSTGGSNNTYSVRVSGYGGSGDGDFSFTPTSANNVYIQVISGQTISHKKFYPMIRDAAIVDATFSPYNPTLGGMVYGGTVDVSSGKCDVTKAILDLGTRTWIYQSQSQYLRFYTPYTPMVAVPNEQVADALCSHYEMVAAANVDSSHNNVIGLSESKNIIIRDSRYTDVDVFKAAMSGVQLVYELATPITFYIPPAQLKMLTGLNNVSSNGTSIDLEYQPDNVIAEPKADVQKVDEKLDKTLVGNYSNNLFNKEGKQTTTYGTATISGETITVTGTYYCKIDMPLKAGVYTVYGKVKSYGATHGFRLVYEDGSLSSMQDKLFVDTEGKNITALLLYCGTGTSATTVYEYVQVERGSQTAYQEYIPTNKELWAMIKALQ